MSSNMVQWYDLVDEAGAEACARLHAPSVNMSNQDYKDPS
jgi:hypothetical protein